MILARLSRILAAAVAVLTAAWLLMAAADYLAVRRYQPPLFAQPTDLRPGLDEQYRGLGYTVELEADGPLVTGYRFCLFGRPITEHARQV